MKLFVADTGPLLHLQQIGALALLSRLGDIWTTPAVARELLRHAPALEGVNWPSWLRIAEVSATAQTQARRWLQAGFLHSGEAEAVAYARELRPEAVLTDDTEAREFAQLCGLSARGTLGIVLLAAASRIIDHGEATDLLDKLERNSTLWLSAKVRQVAREALEKISRRE